MQKTKRTRIITAVITALVIVFSSLPFIGTSASAATFSQINAPEVFVKQQTSETCTLASNVMMLRRYALLRGDSDWRSITEPACRPTLWCEGAGQYNYYTYKNIKVSFGKIKNNSRQELIALLASHPEGIVAYDYDHPHAVLVTDYTNGVFYCAEPARSCPEGRIKSTETLISMDGIEAYWYVESPAVKLTDEKPIEKTDVNEIWRINTQAGVNVRTGPGTSYSVKGFLPNNSYILVTKKAEAGEYTWGYTKTDSINGWVALAYAVKPNIKPLANKSSISSDKVYTNHTMTVSGSASGGTGRYEYQYAYRKTTDSDYTIIKNYTSDTSAKFKPASSGKYYVRIAARDAVTREYSILCLKLNAEDLLVNSSSLSVTKAITGQKIAVYGSSTGGTGSKQYAYYYKKKNADKLNIIKLLSSDETASFVINEEGEYEVIVRVKDGAGKIVEKKLDLKVEYGFVNTSTVSSVNVNRFCNVKLKASAYGGKGGYKYAFCYQKSTDSKWNIIRGYSDNSEAIFTASTAGTYRIVIKVQDSEGNIAKKYFNITVY